MNFKLKDKPLAVQIWVILGLILGGSFALLTILFPLVLRVSFTREINARLEDSQEYILRYENPEAFLEDLPDRNDPGSEIAKRRPDFNPQQPPYHIRVVRHIFVTDSGQIKGHEVPSDFIEEFNIKAKSQTQEKKYYTSEINKNKIIYLIRRVEITGEKGYLISYLWGRYQDNLIEGIFWRLIEILLFVLIINWLASIFIARYLTKPLGVLQGKVNEIAARQWDKPVTLNRGDEIGQLGEEIEAMRRQLIEQDQKQQAFLQQVSHELKTPIMVIRSYAQSIQDGVFPKGSLEESVKVIETETGKLEKRVRSLLSLTRLDYLSTQRAEVKYFNLTKLLERVIDSFSWRRAELNWELKLEQLEIKGDSEKLTIALENLLDNQIRYAANTIKIDLTGINKGEDSWIQLRIWNDGPEIAGEILVNLFKKFKKGLQGDFGLGLAIVKVIVEMHQGRVWASNEDNGVAFYLGIPE